MGNLTIATIFIVLANVLLWFSTIAMVSVNPTGTFCYNVEGSIVGNHLVMGANMNTTTLNNDVLSQLPNTEGAVSTGSTGFFTDIFNNVLSWFKSAPGLKYVYGIVSSPYNIIKLLNLPTALTWVISAWWYGITVFLIIAFLWWRD